MTGKNFQTGRTALATKAKGSKPEKSSKNLGRFVFVLILMFTIARNHNTQSLTIAKYLTLSTYLHNSHLHKEEKTLLSWGEKIKLNKYYLLTERKDQI